MTDDSLQYDVKSKSVLLNYINWDLPIYIDTVCFTTTGSNTRRKSVKSNSCHSFGCKYNRNDNTHPRTGKGGELARPRIPAGKARRDTNGLVYMCLSDKHLK